MLAFAQAIVVPTSPFPVTRADLMFGHYAKMISHRERHLEKTKRSPTDPFTSPSKCLNTVNLNEK